eukprot:Nitzschia sp. Nitz4//scaffold3_size479765//298808//300193//NITZ4_000123-RA/size479765-processed-gene-1.468-mRNA-1//1//CDS//3329550827//7383//frame0
MAINSPRKRKAADSPKKPKSRTEQVKIIVDNTSSQENPILVSFPGGLPESIQQSTTSESERPTCQWQKLSQKSSAGREVTAKDKHCSYSAYSRGLGYDDRRTKVCVGVYDKSRGVVMIREAASKGTVFALQQSVPSYLEKNGTEEQNALDRLAYSTSVFEDFGSAKKQRVLKSQAANRVDINHVVGAGSGSAVMQQVLNGESMSESNIKAIAENKANGGTPSRSISTKAVDLAQEAARRNLLPDYDENANKPDRVYNAREIAGTAAWTRIYNKVHACTHSDDVVEEVVSCVFEKDWSPSALKVVKATNPEKADAKDRFTSAILVNWLIKFFTNNQRKRTLPPVIESKSTYFGIPAEVASRWITLFTTAIPDDKGDISRAMSKQDKDKCVVHALILYMISQGPAMKIPDLKPIAEDLKKPVNDCAVLLREAGCQVTKKGTAVAVALKTPLTFPPPRRAKSGN